MARLVRTPWDEEKGPKVVLPDGTETIFVADMSGDGLNDIVRVRNGETCYWPNIGYGRFGTKVTMDLRAALRRRGAFEPQRIRLADIDGIGSADILYIGADGVRVWFNQSGNAWSAPTTHRGVPRRRPTERCAGARPARHRHRLSGLVLAVAGRIAARRFSMSI